VRQDDLPDAHHQVGMKIYNKIGLLIATYAYFKSELRIINDVCRRWRRHYWIFGEPLESGLKEVEGKRRFKEDF